MTDRTVPTEPTWEMQIAGRDAILSEDDTLDISTDDARAAYIAMLAASPPAPAAEPVAWAVYWQGGLWALCETKREAVREAGDLEPKGEKRPLYTHPLDAAAIRAEARREALEAAAAYHDEEAECYHKLMLGNVRARNAEKTARCEERVQWHRAQAGALRALAGKGEAER